MLVKSQKLTADISLHALYWEVVNDKVEPTGMSRGKMANLHKTTPIESFNESFI